MQADTLRVLVKPASEGYRDLMASGSDIVQTAKRHLGEHYVLGSVADYANPNFTGPWDCAEFASWCLYRVSEIHFGARPEGAGWNAYTGFWADDARNAHAAIRWQEAAIVPGAFLVRIPGAHTGVASGHIAICDGSNRTIEAMDPAHGVTKGKIKGRIWDLGVLVPGIDYSEASLSRFPNALFSLRAGNPVARGPLVARIVHRLRDLGHYKAGASDVYDSTVAAAVSEYQQTKGLVADGEVGPRTYEALFSAAKRSSRAIRKGEAISSRHV
jgi:N-acetylmuramoyl-L-alanine amidase